MFKILIKKLVARYQRNQLAKKTFLREQHNNEVIASILKDLEERAY